MNKIEFFTLALCLVVFCQCNSPKENSTKQIKIVQTISVDVSSEQEINFSDLFEIKAIIPTQLEKDNIIVNAKKIYETTDYFLIISDVAYLLNKNGELLHQIGNKGKGPGEFLAISYSYFNESNKTLEIIDYYSRKFLIYNLNGTLKHESKLPFYVDAFTHSNNKLLFHITSPNEKTNRSLNYYDLKNKEITNSFFDLKECQVNYLHYRGTNNFYSFNNINYYIINPFDTIYQIENERIIPYYAIDFGKNAVPVETYDKGFTDIADFTYYLKDNMYANCVDYVSETNQYLLFSFKYQMRLHRAVYSKKTKQTKVFRTFKFDINANTISKDISQVLWPIGYHNNYYLFYLNAEDFDAYMEVLKRDMSNIEWNKFCEKNTNIVNAWNISKEALSSLIIKAKSINSF